jgi:CRISPR-associated endonuclease/helicase Cas3
MASGKQQVDRGEGGGGTDFKSFFRIGTDGHDPYPWQGRVAREGLPEVLSVPTGLGKTEGVALGWSYRRLITNTRETPRHLVICLPMRVLVRQTEERLTGVFHRLGEAGFPKVGVHSVMGGKPRKARKDDDDAWLSHPEKPWVLIGTQDQLLSRALNRGYALSPFDWPLHFGALNNDAHWVLDEVQLMGPAVWTSAQLDWMRRVRFGTVFPCSTTWMSATVGANFLDTRDRRDAGLVVPHPLQIDQEDRAHPAAKVRLEARRSIEMFQRTPPPAKKSKETKKSAAAAATKTSKTKNRSAVAVDPEAIAEAVSEAHAAGTLSLVVCNTVRAAQRIFSALPTTVPRKLITSRFRPDDRAEAEEALQQFEEARKTASSSGPVRGPGLICVSTQVVEAGVDISARRLWSEIAPWPSIVQRLGRLNRDGLDNEAARAVFFEPLNDPEGSDKARVGPYERESIDIARQLLGALIPMSQQMPSGSAIAELERGELGELVMKTLAAPRAPLPRAVDVHGLFATERDLYSGFTDVSPYVRNADPNADVSVFWREFKTPLHEDAMEGPAFDAREACPVPVHALRHMLVKAPAYVWDPDAQKWLKIRAEAVRPGMVVMLAGSSGGYRRDLGWTGEASDRLDALEVPGPGTGAYGDDPRSQSTAGWVPLRAHLLDAERQAQALVEGLGLLESLAHAATMAAREHDIGKAHPQWHASLGKPSRDATLWAKFPAQIDVVLNPGATEQSVLNWLSTREKEPEILSRGARMRIALKVKLATAERADFQAACQVRVTQVQLRPGMRHEAASVLAMMHRYVRGESDFPALSIYLVAAHHGKVRTHLRARNRDGDDVCGVPRNSAPLLLDVARPLDFRCAADGAEGEFTEDGFVLRCPGWTAIVSDLLGPPRPDRPWDTGSVPADEPRNLGPFRLAYLEALVRIADWRASALPSEVRNVR